MVAGGKGQGPIGDEISEGRYLHPLPTCKTHQQLGQPTAQPKDSRKYWAEVVIMTPRGCCPFGTGPITQHEN